MKKIACILSGEGARGAVQVSGLKHTEENLGYDFDKYFGISSGAINSFGRSYLNLEAMADIWLQLTSLSKIYRFNYLTFPFASGFLNPKPIKKLMSEYITPEMSMGKEATIARANMITTKAEWMNLQDYTLSQQINGVLGAIAIPCLCQDTNGYLDAGSRVIAPLKKAIAEGYEHIVLIAGSPLASSPQARQAALFPALWQGLNFVSTLLDEIMKRDIRECLARNNNPNYKKIKLEVYEPVEYMYDSLDFSEVKRGLDAPIVKADLSTFI